MAAELNDSVGKLGMVAERDFRNPKDPSAVQGQYPKDECTLSDVCLMIVVSLHEELTKQ